MNRTDLIHTEDEQLLEKLRDCSSSIYKPNQLVVDVGDKLPGVPIVLSGLLKVYRVSEEQEYFLYHIEEGEICAMAIQCCMSHKASTIRIYADSESEVMFVNAENGMQWMQAHPDWMMFILRSVSDKFAFLTSNIDGLAFESLENRLLDYLAEKAEVLKSDDLSITHTEMARDLNSSREVVSRTLKKLQLQGKISKERGIVRLIDRD